MFPEPDSGSRGRSFIPIPHASTGDGAAEESALRRIWEVEADALFVVLGVLLERQELEALFREVERHDAGSICDDALILGVISRCATPGGFAESLERRLDRRTWFVRKEVGHCPMSELAGWWLGARDGATGEQLAALLWSLASDRRWVIRGLFERVRADIWVRALRLLGQRPASGSVLPHFSPTGAT